jgi:hypothetical protein
MSARSRSIVNGEEALARKGENTSMWMRSILNECIHMDHSPGIEAVRSR